MSYNAQTTRINEIRNDLRIVREAIREQMLGGASVSVAGGVTVTRVPIAELRKQETILLRQLNAAAGGSSATVPNFSGISTNP